MSDEPKKPLVEYPTVYAFKVMGVRSGDFHGYVRALFTRLWGAPVEDHHVVENVSKGGNYVSLTVSLRLETETQRLAIYEGIHAEKLAKRLVFYL